MTITLNRAERHNAFNAQMIAELSEAFAQIPGNTRAVLLEANGASFCAGADLSWMRETAAYSFEENQKDAMALANLMERVDRCPCPVIAVVQGAAYGGGVGLIAACDIAIAVQSAVFALSEVRLGLIPAVVSPYVVAAIGPRAARRYFVTAERFSAEEAHRLGLVHEVVAPQALHAKRDEIVKAILAGGAQAQRAAKNLVRVVSQEPRNAEWTADQIAQARASDEGREGVAAFLEKRKPSWLL